MSEKPFFTVFIPTFNRARVLPRMLESIARQGFQDLEVVVVDDGSTDDTEEVVSSWASQMAFPVRYVYQANQGKHAAHNTAVQCARGVLMLNPDSDDRLAPGALKCIKSHWDAIPPNDQEKFAGIEGLCTFIENGQLVGDRFPQDPLDSDYFTVRRRLGVGGDKKAALRTDVLREFPYPVFPGERHVRPSLVWKRIGRYYLTRHINKVVAEKEYLPGGLSDKRFNLRMRNPNGYRAYFLDEVRLFSDRNTLRERLYNQINYVRYSLHAGFGPVQQYQEGSDPTFWFMGYAGGWIKYQRDRWRLRRKYEG